MEEIEIAKKRYLSAPLSKLMHKESMEEKMENGIASFDRNP